MPSYNLMVCTIDTEESKINHNFNSFFLLFFKRFPSLNVRTQTAVNDGCLVCEVAIDAPVDEVSSFLDVHDIKKFAQGSLLG